MTSTSSSSFASAATSTAPFVGSSSWRATASSVAIVASSRSAWAIDRTERVHALGVGFRPRRAERELGARPQPRHRGPQLVRHLGGEALLVAARGGDPLEQPVERGGEARQLVGRRAEVESLVEIVRAPVLCARGHARDRVQGALERAADRQPAGQQHQRRDDQRADQHLVLQGLERLHREPDDDRADARMRAGREHRLRP